MKMILLCYFGVMSCCLLPSSTEARRCDQTRRTEESQKTNDLYWVERAPIPQTSTAPLVIALHGLGDHAQSFHRLSRKLPLHWRVITIEAPWRHPRLPQGRQWYRYRCTEANIDVKQATKWLEITIKSLLKRYPKHKKVALFGFSQGGVMTLSLAAKSPHLLHAAVSLSGYWIGEESQLSSTPTRGRVLMIHGDDDRVVPLKRGQAAFDLFERAGYQPKWFEFNGAHRVTSNVLKMMISHIESSLP